MPDLNLGLVVNHLLHLLGALLLALPVAWDRGAANDSGSLGVRTLPLVAVASAAWALIGHSLFGGDPGAEARILQGLVTGVGFLGGGAIVKQGIDVRGLATAAAIWSMAALGAAVAGDRWEIAIVLSLITFLTLRILSPVKDQLDDNGD